MPSINYSDEVFKKAEQVVDKPATTKLNINEEYMRHPPHNKSEDTLANDREPQWTKEPSKKEKLPEVLSLDAEPLGRVKKEDDLAQIVQEDSVYSSR